MESLIRKSIRKINDTDTSFKRYLYDRIDWSDRLIFIKGARGTGKTTLLLQHLKETAGASDEALYVSLDETFFLNQLSSIGKVNYSEQGDFIFRDKYLFEVGGKTKTQKQIKGFSDAYIVADEIETGYKNKIPIWLFGYLY